MSRKKDHKIKRLRRGHGILPHIIGILLVDASVIAVAGCFIAIAGLGFVTDRVFEVNKDCKTIVNIAETEYQNDFGALQKKIDESTKQIDTIENVFLVNDELELIYSENLDRLFFQDVFKTRNIKKVLDKNGFLREKNADFTDAFYDENFQPKLSEIMPLKKIMTQLPFLNEASEECGVVRQWVVYKTNLKGINLCMHCRYSFSRYMAVLVFILFLSFVFIILVTFISGNKKIIILIFDRYKIHKLVSTDIVTGGINKEFFIKKAGAAIKRNSNRVIVQIRLEKYRNFCTTFGVKEGENLLEDFYREITKLLENGEIAAHLEKADFAVILNFETVEKTEERINEIIDVLSSIRKNQHMLFSAGICQVSSRRDDINALLTSAGLAITKRSESSNNIVWFNDSMKEEQIWERNIEDDMESALENHEFQVYLQPKYSAKEEIPSAAEALVRWSSPKLGFISPGKFIPIFERNGFILKLDDYMLTEVAKQQSKWLEEGKKLLPISVNVSRAHFTTENLAEHICEIVDEYKVPHDFIELELTESAFFDDKAILLDTVRKLKAFGFKVSMDDFGAGYSSLNSLKELPLDIIKLDAEFFRGADNLERSNLIVGDTISLAKKLGMQIVAEGIETREQVDFLANQDCDLIQGFYFSKPLSVDDFEECVYCSK